MTQQEILLLKQRTGWCDEILNSISSMAEANIYIRAGLQPRKISNRWALCRTDISWADFSIQRNTWLKTSTQKRLRNYDHWATYNNADLIGEGYPPRDPNGDPYELHHIGQHHESPLAELTWDEHMGQGNNPILHHTSKESEINRRHFTLEKKAYWKARFAEFTETEIQTIYP